MSISLGDLISAGGTLLTLLSVAWFLRGSIAKIAITLTRIEGGLVTNRDLSVENKNKADASHRRLDDHDVRIAVIESRDE
jgi:hypothetical protein